MANILWALAKLGAAVEPEGELVRGLGGRMHELLEDWKMSFLMLFGFQKGGT